MIVDKLIMQFTRTRSTYEKAIKTTALTADSNETPTGTWLGGDRSEYAGMVYSCASSDYYISATISHDL